MKQKAIVLTKTLKVETFFTEKDFESPGEFPEFIDKLTQNPEGAKEVWLDNVSCDSVEDYDNEDIPVTIEVKDIDI